MRLHSVLSRRPSASLVVSFVALFVALGGAGYAATQLPSNSVGTAQLQDASVTNHKLLNGSVGNFKLQFGSVGPRKLQNGAVGTAQINSSEVQARVTGTCATGSISSISSIGAVQCVSTPPADFATTTASAVTLPSGTSPTSISAEPLSSGSSYLVLANPNVKITGSSPTQAVEVDCTLSVGPTAAAAETRSYSVELGADDQSSSIPLEVTAPSSSTEIGANVSCLKKFSGATPPTVVVSTTINALQIAGNG
jgi:hypothetical protein